MAYTPTVWATGDVITAEKLNKAEQGIAAAAPVVLTITVDDHDTLHLGKSWDDLMDLSGVPVFAKLDISETAQNRYFLANLYVNNGTYTASFVSINSVQSVVVTTFSAESASAELVFAD